MNNNEPPQKNPQKLGKNKHFWHFWNNARHTKNKPFNIKTLQKTHPKKTILPCSKTTHYFFINFLFFFRHTVFVFENLCFPENTIKIVFSGKHSFSKTQLVKPTFSTMSKNTFFKKKVSFLLFDNFRWNPYFYSVFCFALFWSKKKFWPKQIVCTKMRVFSPFLTQIVSGNFC